jgi:hypothetical protein
MFIVPNLQCHINTLFSDTWMTFAFLLRSDWSAHTLLKVALPFCEYLGIHGKAGGGDSLSAKVT